MSDDVFGRGAGLFSPSCSSFLTFLLIPAQKQLWHRSIWHPSRRNNSLSPSFFLLFLSAFSPDHYTAYQEDELF